jgi:hypothetical protein
MQGNALNPQFLGDAGSGRQIDVRAGGVALFHLGSSDFVVAVGSGVPTLSATKGSLYIRTDGSTSATRMYINSTGATTWVACTTAS